MTDQALDAAGAAPPSHRRQVTAAVIGNALEFYDFIIYATFAVQIGRAFFPGHSEFFKLMGALVTFGIGFTTRPIGAVVLGRLGDRIGRRPAMLISFTLMGIGIIGLALTPSFGAIGVAAPILVLVFRLIQGFALGGEVGPTTAFLVEIAPPGRRGLYGAWQSASQGLSTMAGGLVGLGITLSLGDAALQSWGWRVAIGVGAVILPFGYLMRRNLVETRDVEEVAAAHQPATTAFTGHWRILSLGLALIMGATIATYVFSYMTTYAVTTLKLPTAISLGAAIAVGIGNFLGSLAGGALSDRIGRRWLMIWPRAVFILISVPVFQLIVWRGDGVTLLAGIGLLVFLNGASNAPALSAVTESTRKEVRSVAIAVVYATSVAVFGGSTQPIIAELIQVTKDPLAPAWYMAIASVVGLVAALLMRESAPARAPEGDFRPPRRPGKGSGEASSGEVFSVIIGIDLGTTNSAVAIWRDDKVELIPNSLGHRLTPSVVSVDETGDLLVGLPARERIATHPDQTAFAFKRYMGSRRETRLGKQSLFPEELSALVLKSLKADAEAFLGEPVTEAVITVPAYFNDKQRKATRRAGEIAGLKVERLLNEPTAAALAYGIHELGAETQFLVFDLGGGTFDVSILEIFEGVIEVRASTGDNRLGGEDFNELLVQMMRRKFDKEWAGAREDKALVARLGVAAEQARRTLTEHAEAEMSVVWKDTAYHYVVTADAFEAEAEPLLKRLREPVLRALRDSGVHAEALNQVVLVGGATRMPVVRRAVTRMFGRFPAATVNPDEAVAIGAAIQGALKHRDAALKEVVLTDVCPYTLGVNTAHRLPGGGFRYGIFAPIIERNTVVPTSRMHTFSTLENNQTKVAFSIYQGESRLVEDNILLGKLDVPVPRAPAGEVAIDCRFSYDINGLLEVDLYVPQTGERRELVIVDDDELTPAELEARRSALAELKQHPRDADANRAALARAQRCFEDQLGDRRLWVGRLIAQFEDALDSQDLRVAEPARVDLLKALDDIEGETWL